jgi:hypothetical protein
MPKKSEGYVARRSGEAPNLDAFTIDEFCARNGPISRAHYYNLRKDGLGPREMHAGSRVLISAEAAADWRRAREEPRS